MIVNKEVFKKEEFEFKYNLYWVAFYTLPNLILETINNLKLDIHKWTILSVISIIACFVSATTAIN